MDASKRMGSLWIETLRGGFVDSVNRVRAVVLGTGPAGDEQIEFCSGDSQQPVFWRSTAKFVQALSLFTSGAVEKFAITDTELALICGSHSGSAAHVATVAQLLQRIGAEPKDLHCGPHIPLGTAEARALAECRDGQGPEPSRLHNNCSGKHTGMLAVCLARGWPLGDYFRLEHPLQQEILRHLAEVTDLPVSDIQTAVDGCGAVVFRTPLVALARAYKRLAAAALPPPHQQAGVRLLAAMRAAPNMVAGSGRLCTNLMQTTQGRLVGKVGAGGLYCVGRAENSGYGLAIKIEDGNDKLIDAVVCRLAVHLGWLSQEEFLALRPHWELPIFNHQRELVGEVVVRVAP